MEKRGIEDQLPQNIPRAASHISDQFAKLFRVEHRRAGKRQEKKKKKKRPKLG